MITGPHHTFFLFSRIAEKPPSFRRKMGGVRGHLDERVRGKLPRTGILLQPPLLSPSFSRSPLLATSCRVPRYTPVCLPGTSKPKWHTPPWHRDCWSSHRVVQNVQPTAGGSNSLGPSRIGYLDCWNNLQVMDEPELLPLSLMACFAI